MAKFVLFISNDRFKSSALVQKVNYVYLMLSTNIFYHTTMLTIAILHLLPSQLYIWGILIQDSTLHKLSKNVLAAFDIICQAIISIQ